MIEPVPLTTAQKKVLGLKKTIGSKKQQQKKNKNGMKWGNTDVSTITHKIGH